MAAELESPNASHRKPPKKPKSEKKRRREEEAANEPSTPKRKKKRLERTDETETPPVNGARDFSDEKKKKPKEHTAGGFNGIHEVVGEPVGLNGGSGSHQHKKSSDDGGQDSAESRLEGEGEEQKSRGKNRSKSKSKSHREIPTEHAEPVTSSIIEGGASKKSKIRNELPTGNDHELSQGALPDEYGKKKKKYSKHLGTVEEKPRRCEKEAPDNQEQYGSRAPEKERKRLGKEAKKAASLSSSQKPHRSSAASKDLLQPNDCPDTPGFPFVTQVVSLYVPLYPQGWDSPVTSATEQHLEPLVDRYVPSMGGVLLGYRDVSLSSQPTRRGAARTDNDTAVLRSKDEYAVGFGWVTAEADLFKPRRGAWMEGRVTLQNEGHLGVVCWNLFNASIEARRLPSHWHWVHAGTEEATSYDVVPDTGEGGDFVPEMHSSGFWADGAGSKVSGRVRFRLRNFEVGISGAHSFLVLEGSMLTAEEEKEATEAESHTQAMRKDARGVLAKERRVVPQWSMTTFGKPEDQEEERVEKLEMVAAEPDS